MAGGLIQIATYGSQDIYLTGTPEITFFNVVYRRHTNFAIESIKLDFDNTVGFGKEAEITIPKIGDLINKMYVEITLPTMDLKRQPISDILIRLAQESLNTKLGDLNIVLLFMELNRQAYANAYDLYIAENIQNASLMAEEALLAFAGIGAQAVIDNMIALLLNSQTYEYIEISLYYMASNYVTGITKEELFNIFSEGIGKSIRLQDYYRKQVEAAEIIVNDMKNPNLKFAWINKIGHAIMESIEIKIGGHKIDKHYGDWLNIWHELSGNINKEYIYNKMIGNIDILTNFDRTVKQEYLLDVPLQFWFCQHSGLSLPLIALEYHDVSLNIKFRKIEEVGYIEDGETIIIRDNSNIYLMELPAETGINIKAQLIIDYIYIDSAERRRFAQSSHEYLIEQLQSLDVSNIMQSNYQFVLNNFVHPSKELIWIAQKESYISNPSGYKKLQWDNYTLSDNYIGQIIEYSSLSFNGYDRTYNHHANYYNYVQPYEHHQKTPSVGINVYSFSITPEESQPSGSSNLSMLSKIVLDLKMNNQLSDPITIRVYSKNYNILRFINGLAATAYTYG